MYLNIIFQANAEREKKFEEQIKETREQAEAEQEKTRKIIEEYKVKFNRKKLMICLSDMSRKSGVTKEKL